MQGKKTKWDRLTRLTDLLEEKIRDHPDETQLTDKLAAVLTEANGGIVATNQTGACHFIDGTCQELTEADCIAAKGIGWDGPGTHCPMPKGKASVAQVSAAQ